MRDRIFRLVGNRNGYISTALVLIMAPLLLFMIMSSNDVTRVRRVTNTTLSNAVAVAVKDSASMVNSECQAMGKILIDPDRALEQFKDSLLFNLNLTMISEGDIRSSVRDDLKYWLLVYNGEGHELSNGETVRAFTMFTNTSGWVSDEEDEAGIGVGVGTETSYNNDSITGFPYTIRIDELGIFDDGNRGIKVTLEEPSVVAVVRANVTPLIGRDGVNVSRWGYARVITKDRLRERDD